MTSAAVLVLVIGALGLGATLADSAFDARAGEIIHDRAKGEIRVEMVDGQLRRLYKGIGGEKNFLMTAVSLDSYGTLSATVEGKDLQIITVRRSGVLACKNDGYCLARKEDGQVILAVKTKPMDLKIKYLEVQTILSPEFVAAIEKGEIKLSKRDAEVLGVERREAGAAVVSAADKARLTKTGGFKATFSDMKSDARGLRFVPVGEEGRANAMYILASKGSTPAKGSVSPVIEGLVNKIEGAFEVRIGPGNTLVLDVRGGTGSPAGPENR
jgi:hypothetical protein